MSLYPRPVGIVATGAFTPVRRLTNADLEQMVDTSDEWIRTRSGIRTRHIADPGTALSDLAVPAAQAALERAGLAPEEVDLVVMATVTGDVPVPSTASIVQHRLGASRAAAFDLAAACSGFVYALSVAAPLVGVGQYRNAVVIGGDVLSRITDYTDRTTCVLFGDAAGAVVLQPVPEPRGFMSSYLRSDGGGAGLLTVLAGGSRKPASLETVQAREHYLRMAGNEVFKFAVRALEEAVLTALAQAGLTTADVSLVIPHQANLRIIEAAAKRLEIAEDRWAVNIQEYGCTSAASIPLAMTEAHQAGRIHEGDVIVLVAFGGGLTWAATVVRW
ncbi:MAG: beta-ketoacyl-ACP synthase III [Armatimonadota bacterium]